MKKLVGIIMVLAALMGGMVELTATTYDHDQAVAPMSFDMSQAAPAVLDIKDHPQKVRYNSPAEWPAVDHQCHWKPGNIDPTILTHVHITTKLPWYAILRGQKIRAPFKLQMFHVDGFVAGIYVNNGHASWAKEMTFDGVDPDGNGFDENGQPLRLTGDPNGLKVYTGNYTIDPMAFEIQKGWTHVNTEFDIRFADERVLVCSAATLVYVETDPNAPDQTGDLLETGFPRSGATFASSGMGRQGQDSALHFVQLRGLLPLAPIDSIWPFPISGNRYGLNEFLAYLSEGRTQLFFWPDLHNHQPGVLQREVVARQTAEMLDLVLNPAAMVDGNNRVLIRWSQPTEANAIYDGSEQIEALMTFDVVVGDAPAPIDTDGDGVTDDLDQCDFQPGPAPSGCPIIAPPPPVDALRAELAEATALAMQFPSPLKEQLLAAIAAVLALIGG